MQDRYKIGTSADVGLGVKTKLPAHLQLVAIYANGTGYKHAENDKYKKLYTQLAYMPDDNFTAALFFDYEPQDDNYANTTITVFAGTKLRLFTGGIEFVNRTIQDTTNLSATGISIFGNVDVKIGKLFLRVDQMKSELDPDHETDELTYILGFDYQAAKNVHIMPNYKSAKDERGGTTAALRLSFEYKF